MIIICNKPGQLGNRLIVFASFIAFAREHNLKLLNPAFDEYTVYFDGSGPAVSMYPRASKSWFSLYKLRRINYFFFYYLFAVIKRLRFFNGFIKTIAISENEELDIETNKILKESKGKIILVKGWKFRANTLLVKNRNEIIKYFIPSEKYFSRIESYAEKVIKSGTRIYVGIHIRRGDYKSFENGIYYYSDEQYLQQIKRVSQLLKARDLTFILCSNETLNLDYFRQNNLSVETGPGFELDDLYTLSKCDYIIGPPSTFTMWASFYGEKPLYMIKNPQTLFELKDFEVINEF
ncbi:alpha-1,2-fucosyltransferase [Sporocytophaga myxococcoides]|uniref:alpha-1,2-fucosyltransferase n=1 Tax=Sporocytophaga myxococcoides TaxID=153721 RepID=UPI00048EBFD7|nr:alpha-1,2-fucosyltransferase [Sporocytophaga myxococcoides]